MSKYKESSKKELRSMRNREKNPARDDDVVRSVSKSENYSTTPTYIQNQVPVNPIPEKQLIIFKDLHGFQLMHFDSVEYNVLECGYCTKVCSVSKMFDKHCVNDTKGHVAKNGQNMTMIMPEVIYCIRFRTEKDLQFRMDHIKDSGRFFGIKRAISEYVLKELNIIVH